MRLDGVRVLFDHPKILAEPGVQVQVNNAPETLEVRLIFVEFPWQIPFVKGVVVRSGVGLTETIKFVAKPAQPFE